MTQVQRLEHATPGARSTINDATLIPPLSHTEAATLASVELERFLAVVEGLSAEDWSKPTICPLWNVRQVVAHVTGAAAAYARWSEFKRQNNLWVQRSYRKAGFSLLDALNQIQVDDRATATPADLIAELRDVGPRAIATRQRLPALVRAIRLPLPLIGVARIDYLTDLIYTRDMWMHRLDICRATDQSMVQTADHDGRIVALVIRDLAKKLMRKLGGTSIVYDLSGITGGAWRIGRTERPAVVIQIDVLNFNLLASGRLTVEAVRSHPATVISGDEQVAQWVLAHTAVPY